MTEWARRYQDGQKAFEYARRAQVQALGLRCGESVPGLLGATLRCTADELPFHVHRYDTSEVPAELVDEEAWKR